MTDFWNCSLWEFNAAVAGWSSAQPGAEDPASAAPSVEDYEKMLEQNGYTL